LALGAVVLALVVTELGLRVVLPEARPIAPGLYVGHPGAGVPYMSWSDPHQGWIRARQELSPAAFVPGETAPGGLRVAMLGGSTVETCPPGGPAWQLAALLEQATDGRATMINAGGKGYGTARIEGLQRELLERQLDAVVLYTGHNEFVETRNHIGLSLLRPHPNPVLRRLAGLRLGQLAGRVLVAPPSPDAEPRPMDPAEAARLADHFATQLRAIGAAARDAGVPSVWVLPASNLARAPQCSYLEPSLADGELQTVVQAIAGAEAALERSHMRGVLSSLDPLFELTEAHAGAWYLRGRALAALGDADEAQRAMVLARDLDACPKRASGRLVEVMRSVASEHDVAVVDAEALLLAEDPARYRSGGYSADLMHLNAPAYAIVAAAVYAQLASALDALEPIPDAQIQALGVPMQLRRRPFTYGTVSPVDDWGSTCVPLEPAG